MNQLSRIELAIVSRTVTKLLGPEEIKIVMEREYMSQTDIMRTLEALVSAVGGLKDTFSWKMPLVFGLVMTIILAIYVAIVSWILD